MNHPSSRIQQDPCHLNLIALPQKTAQLHKAVCSSLNHLDEFGDVSLNSTSNSCASRPLEAIGGRWRPLEGYQLLGLHAWGNGSGCALVFGLD